MNKIKEFLNKTVDHIKANKKRSLLILISFLTVLALVITVICLSGNSPEEDPPQWGEGITEGIPAFGEEFKSFDADSSFQTMYYENVTTEQVKDYETRLSDQCGIVFQGEIYPRSAIYGDKIIVIHYNVTEMKFSVTVTQKSNS